MQVPAFLQSGITNRRFLQFRTKSSALICTPSISTPTSRKQRTTAAISRPGTEEEDISDSTTTQSPVQPDHLTEFSEAVEGEWKGYEGNFDASTGTVLTIPDYYIPDQFREWTLEPKGFETNHSTIVRSTTLFRKFFRILPTVSLFGDHVDLEEEFHKIDILSNDVHIFADGTFVYGPDRVNVKKVSKLEKWPRLEFCVRYQEEALNVWLEFDFDKLQFKGKLRAVIERHGCQYCDGADLEGSSGFVDGWPSGRIGNASELQGEWRTDDDGVVIRGNEVNYEVTPTWLFLPGGVDLCLKKVEDGAVSVQVGWRPNLSKDKGDGDGDGDVRVVVDRVYNKDGCTEVNRRVVERRVS